MECHVNLILKFIEILSTPWHAAVDHDWSRKVHAPANHLSGHVLALLSMPSQSVKDALISRY